MKEVPRLGPKAFEQCAGFLRIPGGEDPLDASGVHPEAYPVVRRIIQAAKIDIRGLIGNVTALRALSPKNFVDDTFGRYEPETLPIKVVSCLRPPNECDIAAQAP